ncbi:MAG: hypothetical protein KJ607_02705, partial [Bacteroidetes bacterium]|nr:hypothetical protein [Bacteroidota bacterium]
MNKIAIITVLLTMIYCKSFTQEWHTGMLPEPAWVFDFLKYNDKLYFTGSFPSVDVDTVTLNSIAYWDSLTMHPLGFGITSIGGAAWSLEEFADCIIVGGSFIEAGGVQNTNRLAKFDGQNWSPVGDSGYPDGEVRAMKNFNGELYIGGGFGHIGSILLWGVGKFDGTNWINIGSSGCSIYAMDIYNNDLYLGGSFTSMGGTFADGLVRNDGSGWQAVGGGVNGYILDMVVDSINNFLYVAGAFSTIDDTIYANDLAVWDGYEWNNFDFSTNNEISEIEIYRGDVYIGGFFTQFGDINDTICIGRWNGIEWDTLPGRLWSTVQALEVYKDELYVGGYLYEVNGDTCYALARWYMPPGYNCNMLEPRVYCAADTFYMQLGEA